MSGTEEPSPRLHRGPRGAEEDGVSPSVHPGAGTAVPKRSVGA